MRSGRVTAREVATAGSYTADAETVEAAMAAVVAQAPTRKARQAIAAWRAIPPPLRYHPTATPARVPTRTPVPTQARGSATRSERVIAREATTAAFRTAEAEAVAGGVAGGVAAGVTAGVDQTPTRVVQRTGALVAVDSSRSG
eukprot:g26821.t1